MKKYLITAVLIFPFFVAAQTASSTDDLQTIIKQLQTQVADLQTEVQSLKIELKFSRALTQGAKGDDVKQLQEFLRTFTGAYPEGLVTGYYGPNTKAAVKKFQEQNGIEPLGIVGPMTREKLNVLVAAIPATSEVAPVQHNIQTTTTAIMPATSQSETEVRGLSTDPAIPATQCKAQSGAQIQPASVKVLSPDGGEKWQIGGTYTIKYTAKGIAGNKALLIYLEKGYDAPSTKTGANSRLLIGVTTNLESYTYKIPSNIQSYPGLGNNYKITVIVEGSFSSCGGDYYDGDSSDAPFSIVAGQNNIPRAVPTTTISVPATTTSVNGGGYGKENTSLSLTDQIVALQKKLQNTTDDAVRTSLTNQITELKKQLQILADKKSAVLKQIMALEYKLYYATDATVRASLEAQIIALGGQVRTTPTTQDQINSLMEGINAKQDKLNKTTDLTAREQLVAQIAAYKAQLQILQGNSQAPAVQPTTKMPSDSVTTTPTSIPQTHAVTDKPTPTTTFGERTAEDLLKQINSLQSQLNITTDISKRDYLIKLIIEMQAQVQLLQGN